MSNEIEARRLLVREYNTLREEIKTLSKKLEKMEAHEGEDGTPEDQDGQCSLVETIAAKQRRVSELKSIIYPK